MAADIRTDLDRFSPLEISTPDPARLLRRPQRLPLASGPVRGDDARRRALGPARRRQSRNQTPRAGCRPQLPAEARRRAGAGNRAVAGVAAIRGGGGSGAPCWITATGLRSSTCRCWSRSSSSCPYYGVKWYRQSQVAQRLIEGDGPEQPRLRGDEQAAPGGPQPAVRRACRWRRCASCRRWTTAASR